MNHPQGGHISGAHEVRNAALEVPLTSELLQKLKIEPYTQPQKQSTPEPDVSFELTHGSTVGVEVTALQLQDSEAYRNQRKIRAILACAENMRSAFGGTPVDVGAFMSIPSGVKLELTRNNRTGAARQLLELINRHSQLDALPMLITSERDEEPILGRLFLDEVRISHAAQAKPKWMLYENASMPAVSDAEIIQTIAKKESKVARYRQNYAERWLLIHNGYGKEPINVARYVPDCFLHNQRIVSKFSKIFLMSRFDGIRSIRTEGET